MCSRTSPATDGGIEIIARIRALAKKSVSQKAELNLRDIVSEVLSLVSYEVQSQHIILQKELADDLPAVSGDKVQLQQVLLNLVMNAIEAMNGIRDRRLELTVKIDRTESGIVVAVTDRGPGIKPPELDRVFDAFHTTKNANLGMGLSICRSIIEAHGGKLWAESNIGPGITFKFTLPPIS
jgi:signal transduction histidine kinase